MLKTTVLLASIGVVSLSAMQQPLQVWVQALQSIEVKTIKETIDVPITNNSTVIDVKGYLQNDQGIPVNQQLLYCLVTEGAILPQDVRGPKLENDLDNIKAIVNMTNSNRFALYLSLPSPKKG